MKREQKKVRTISKLKAVVENLKDREEQLLLEINHLRATQTQTELSRDRYSYFFDYAPQGYVIMNIYGVIEEINLTASALVNKSRYSLIGQLFEHLICPTDRVAFRTFLRNCCFSNSTQPEGKQLYVVRAEGPVPVELYGIRSHEYPPGSNALLIQMMIIDLTQQRQVLKEHQEVSERERTARAEAEKANRVKDEFMAIVSHELRTPLQPIISWVELLRRNSSPEFVAKGLKIIERSAKGQAQIIEDLLDVSRMTSGKLTLQKKPMELNTIISSILETFRCETESADITLVSDVQTNQDLIFADAGRLQQVLWNLLSNSLKFTPTRGRIEVRVRNNTSTIKVRVTDTGCGIHPQLLPQIFHRFTQGDAGSTRSKGGLGLGLPISLYLIQQHGGTITAESPGVEKGATFTITLPLARPEDSRSAGPQEIYFPKTEDFSVIKGLRILITDDEIDAREALSSSLAEFGAHVKTASSAKETLAILQNYQPDVLLSDIAMPGEDGYSLIKKIRNLEASPIAGIPAGALTAYASEGDRKRIFEAGFQEHIVKPVDYKTLARAVKKLISLKGKIERFTHLS